MNIAFTSILIFVLLAPGFLSRIAFNSFKLSVRNPNKNIVNELTWSIIPSLTIHIVAMTLIEFFSNYYVDFNQLGNLMLGVDEQTTVKESFDQLRKFICPIFFYNLSVFSFSFILGFGAQKLIRLYGLDRTLRYLSPLREVRRSYKQLIVNKLIVFFGLFSVSC